ncbi:MAG: rRNA maturation RNase YbeY [Proteobacteria bacterium]|nr:MAG: rRNA maturation RNase YbeY [Pseudomonadota bacterium]
MSNASELPAEAMIAHWAQAALQGHERYVEVGVRIVDESEIIELNQRFRKKAEPTNVLSFPFEDPPGTQTDVLGDVVVCAPIVSSQAQTEGKPLSAHWAHMVVHGIMHLRGYDHETPEEANAMEHMETRILEGLGFPDPYALS